MSSPIRVAIVDDDAELRDALLNLLRSAGMVAAAFATAEDFLAQTDPTLFDVVLTDYQMPGLDGPELIRSMRARGDLTPAIVMTGASQPMLRSQAIEAGAADFLSKPFDADLLVEIIERFGSTGPQSKNGAR